VTSPQDLDDRFRTEVGALTGAGAAGAADEPVREGATLTGGHAYQLFRAQLASRHLDLAARWLRSFNEGFYTIGSSGHEGNAAVAAAVRPTDPALLHYRSGAFYAARAMQANGLDDAIRDVLRGLVASALEPIAGGRHKVFGSAALNVIPTTSTIASHLPRAVGIGFAIERLRRLRNANPDAAELQNTAWPNDALAVCSFGDASVNHAAAVAAFNTAGWCDHSGLRLPVLFVCEDNGIGISVRSPEGWVARTLSAKPGLSYFAADGGDLVAAFQAATEAATWVRRQRRPAILHLRMVRLMGHAGADAEQGYRSATEIAADTSRDPLIATAKLLVEAGLATPTEVLHRYDEIGWQVRKVAEEVLGEPKLADAAEVVAPLAPRRPARVARMVSSLAEFKTSGGTGALDAIAPAAPAAPPSVPSDPAASASVPSALVSAADSVSSASASSASASSATSPSPDAVPSLVAPSAPAPAGGAAAAPVAVTEADPEDLVPGSADAAEASPVPSARATDSRATVFGGRLPEDSGALTLAQSVNAALTDTLTALPQALVFGEDVAAKGGVYGVTKGLRDRFGAARVFDTLLDETSILGLALGAGLAGTLPIPEVQYLAYLHNAEDQLRGEAATMSFFSNGAYRNPMVLRIAGLAYQEGFGGHFHNDNAVAALRDIPGILLACPARPDDAAALLRTLVASALVDGTVGVFLEPIALYHTRDLYEPGDGGWAARYPDPEDWSNVHVPVGRARVDVIGSGTDLTIITFGNGVRMSLRVAAQLAADGVGSRVVDLRWLSPLPVADIVRESAATGRVLIVDETRRSGGVGEGVLAALVDAGFVGVARRVASIDSFIPLGPAARHVLVGEDSIMQGAHSILES
jgi:2-oxoisovalerate dehydrogenase E1 component